MRGKVTVEEARQMYIERELVLRVERGGLLQGGESRKGGKRVRNGD